MFDRDVISLLLWSFLIGATIGVVDYILLNGIQNWIGISIIGLTTLVVRLLTLQKDSVSEGGY